MTMKPGRSANPIRKAILAVVLAASAFGIAGEARAQSYNAMTCDQLWYARNSIYANKGYCFKTQQAINVFGARCYPPYGKLDSYEQSQVDQIRQVEKAHGCGTGGSGGYVPPPQPQPQPMPQPGGYAGMSCGELWYARNSIYANKGYCFKTQRAINAFGPRCYPPYGKLNSAEQSQVDAIRGWEASKGCN
ncbi:MAG: YARHG domain-containing protein [Rhodobiaceae bacterium]|nr:YARHG domain-containing protein [Rhodobiaceae bacterium]MCC0041400.1 YARHG domain-containing protein [Rhodobiaceae bacterium]